MRFTGTPGIMAGTLVIMALSGGFASAQPAAENWPEPAHRQWERMTYGAVRDARREYIHPHAAHPRRQVVIVHREREREREPRVASWVHRAPVDLLRCRSIVNAVGDQALTDEGAKTEANKAWAQTARWSFGEKVISIQYAEDITYQCGRSSIGATLGQTFHRCEIRARPCEPPVTSGEK
jgi:hypothetical protein